MAPEKTEALLVTAGDPFSTRGSFSESIRSSGKQV